MIRLQNNIVHGKRLVNVLMCIAMLVLCSTACNKEANIDKIEEKRMVKLLAELHISEAATQQFDITLRDSFRQIYYLQLFEIHDVKQIDFEAQMKRLKKDPMQLSALYGKVLKELEQSKKQKEREKKPKKEDSQR